MPHILDQLDPTVLGQKLKQARTARGLRQEDVAKKLGIVRTTLIAIEQGSRRVTARELAEMSTLYGRPMSEWLAEEPAPVPLVPQFRLPSSQMRLTEADVQSAVSNLESLARDYLALEQINEMPLVRRYPAVYQHEAPGVSPESCGEEVAATERTRLGLGDGPILDLRSLMEESLGLRIFYYDLPATMGGLYAYSEDLGGCIGINRRHPAPRAVWSLAHECGHFLTTRFLADVSLWDDEPWGKSSAERFADSFAKNFLMPRAGVNRVLTEFVRAHGKGVTVADVMTLAHQFRVSAEAMFRRLEELKRLPSGTWDKLRAQKFQPDKARVALGLLAAENPEPTLPFRYRMLTMWAYDVREALTEGQLADYLRMDRVAARHELERLRAMADQQSDDGFEPLDVQPEPERILVPA